MVKIVINGVDVAESVIKVGYFKLSAGWPLASFKIPQVNFTILKTALDDTGVNVNRFFAYVTGKRVQFNLLCVANLKDKNSDFYEVEGIYKNNFTGVYEVNHPDYNTAPADKVTSSYCLPVLPYYYHFPLKSIYGAISASYPNDPTSDFIFRAQDLYFMYLDEARIRDILKLSRWYSFYSPGILTKLGNRLIPLSSIKLNDPVAWNTDLTTLDVDQVIKWSRTDYRPGFEVEMEGEGYTVNKVGKGPSHSVNLDSYFTDLLDEDGNELDPDDLMTVIKANISNLLDYVGSTVTSIETLENISINTYSKVVLDGEKYYCLEAQIPIIDDVPFKYKLIKRLQ